jgi:hypothetical protein
MAEILQVLRRGAPKTVGDVHVLSDAIIADLADRSVNIDLARLLIYMLDIVTGGKRLTLEFDDDELRFDDLPEETRQEIEGEQAMVEAVLDGYLDSDDAGVPDREAVVPLREHMVQAMLDYPGLEPDRIAEIARVKTLIQRMD